MSLNTSSSNDATSSPILVNQVKFGVFLTLQISSVTCSLYLFLQYIIRPNLRQSVYNQIVIILLCVNFFFVIIPLSASEAFFFTSHVRPESDIFCALWTWISYCCDICNLFLMAFFCGQRHWLLFRLNPMHRRRNRLLYHYVPITACIIYPCVFYFVLIFLYPCQSTYDYSQLLCSYPCYFNTESIGNFDTFANNWVPIIVIPVLSIALLIRFRFQRRRMQLDVFQWKRDRKMVIQLLSVASLYFFMWAPLQAAVFYSGIVYSEELSYILVVYLYILPYFVHLLYPFIVLCSYPEFRWRRAVIVPQENHALQTMTGGRRT